MSSCSSWAQQKGTPSKGTSYTSETSEVCVFESDFPAKAMECLVLTKLGVLRRLSNRGQQWEKESLGWLANAIRQEKEKVYRLERNI